MVSQSAFSLATRHVNNMATEEGPKPVDLKDCRDKFLLYGTGEGLVGVDIELWSGLGIRCR